MREKQRDNLLLPLNSGRMNQVASTGIKLFIDEVKLVIKTAEVP